DLNTYLGVTRIMDYAFGVARHEVVMVDKSNAMTHAGALWQQQWKAVAKKHPNIKTRHLYVDAAAMQLVRDPTQFEVIVTGNLFGDILSDLTAELIGGMGIAPSGNINPQTKRGLFEPVHGTAPDIAGRGIVNPIGAILSASMMVRHLGHTDMANAIEGAVSSAIRAGACTQDHFQPAKDAASATLGRLTREFSQQMGIKWYFEVGQGGICHTVLPEHGLVLPGELVVGADSHSCTYGALNNFATGIGSTDLACVLALGELWFRVPETLKFVYRNRLKEWVEAKDLILYVIGQIGVDGA